MAAPSETPSAELLEFLGEFADERGEWIDPLDFERALDEREPRDGGVDD